MNAWIECLKNPKGTLSKEKANSDMGKAIVNVAKAGALLGLVIGLFLVITGSVALGGMADVGAIISIVLVAIILPISFLIIQVILLVISKVLVGKGTFEQQAYLSSIVAGAGIVLILAAMTLVGVLFLVATDLGVMLGAVLILIALLYNLYLNILALKEAHDFSFVMALVVMIVYTIIMQLL